MIVHVHLLLFRWSIATNLAILTVEVTDENRLEKRHVDILREISEATGILIWKASVFIENEKQTDDAMEYLRTADTKPSQPSARHRTGFIARPFEKSFDFIGRNIEDAFRSRQVQATIYRPAADSPFVAQEMLEQISIAHFGIADITSLNQNVLIEIGVMIGISKPTIILKRKDDNSSIPFNIAGRQCFLYEQTGEEIFIYDAALKKMHLQEFIVEFVDKLSSSNRDFRMARGGLELVCRSAASLYRPGLLPVLHQEKEASVQHAGQFLICR